MKVPTAACIFSSFSHVAVFGLFVFIIINVIFNLVFHREILNEMGELGVLGPTIKGRENSVIIKKHIILI